MSKGSKVRRTEPLTPFRIAAPSDVRAEPWLLAETREAIGDRAEHWDPDLKLRLIRAVTVDLDAVLASTGLDSPCRLTLATVWRSDRTRLRGSGMSIPLRDRSGEAQASLSLDIPGHLAGGSVELRTALVLTEAWKEASPIVAKRVGSVLWSDKVAVALEGSAARFPVTVIDFAEVPGLANMAPWALEWTPHDLDQPVLGAMRLLVNSAVPAVVQAISGSRDPHDVAIATLIRFDVARSFVHGALSQESLVQGSGDFEEDSVGRMLQDLLERYWPSVAPEILARRLVDTPQKIESELQAKTGLLAP